jgi:hypothetical protein
MFYRCQRFNSKPIQRLKMVQEERSKGNRSAPWSGAPDCPVCHRTVSGAPGTVHSELYSFGFLRRSSAIIHRTVWCSTGLSCVLAGRNGRFCKVNSAIHMSEQKVRGAPDCQCLYKQETRKSSRLEDRLCYICRKKGHQCKDCPIGNCRRFGPGGPWTD